MTQERNIKKSYDYIMNIDFSLIINKIVSHQKWNRSDAEEVCRLYRNYLILNIKYPDKKLPPSDDIDEFWHNHILDTKKYRIDCDNIFGFYMDHYPYFGIDGTTNVTDLTNSFDETQKLHHQEFGEYIYEVRSPIKKLLSEIKKICF